MNAASGPKAPGEKLKTPATPPSAPTPTDIADRDAFDNLVDQALIDVRASADKWRSGLAALVTLSTTALLISGPASASDLAGATRYWIVGLLVLGLIAALAGLWLALTAANGVPANATYYQIRATYGSVREFRVHVACHAAKLLGVARWVVAVGLVAFIAAMTIWWLVPPNEPKISIVTATETYCGELKSADGQVYRIRVTGESTPRSIPFSDVVNVGVVSECD